MYEDDRYTRTISKILSMYYKENRNQAEIAQAIGISTSKVNRLIKRARALGMVDINIHVPYKNLLDLENKIEDASRINEAIVFPRFSDDENAILQNLGKVAADYFLSHLRNGDIVCVGGGRTLYELVMAIKTSRSYDVRIVPAMGGVQGRHYTDVNYLVAELAERLGGTSIELHAPAFVDSEDERNTLLSLRQVKEVLNLASKAQIALVGIGSLMPESASYFKFTSISPTDLIIKSKEKEGVGEMLAQIYTENGDLTALNYTNRFIGLELVNLRRIPLVIGIAAMHHKVAAIIGALRGKFLNTLITDEPTAEEVLKILRKPSNI